eukprot:m.131830 g.131830  ORF g.131830 m.131830 type:complete len:310 (-) comp16473_c0_seq2:266-1195(-)
MDEDDDGGMLPMETRAAEREISDAVSFLRSHYPPGDAFAHQHLQHQYFPTQPSLAAPAIPPVDSFAQPVLHLVVDTNVFIGHLDLLNNLLLADNQSPLRCIMVVPWVVLQELDGLKSASHSATVSTGAAEGTSMVNVSVLARRASQFLFVAVEAGRIRIQTIDESNTPFLDWTPDSNDDRILHCSMDLQRRYHRLGRVVLLTNDLNLRLKAKAHGVSVNRKRMQGLGVEDLVSEIVFMYTNAAHPETPLMVATATPMDGDSELVEETPAVKEWCICSRIAELHRVEDHDRPSQASLPTALSSSDMMDDS